MTFMIIMLLYLIFSNFVNITIKNYSVKVNCQNIGQTILVLFTLSMYGDNELVDQV